MGGKHRGSNDKGHEANEENASVEELLDQAEANFLAGGARGGDETLAAAAIAASDTLEIITFHTCHCFWFRSSAEKKSNGDKHQGDFGEVGVTYLGETRLKERT